MAKKSLKNTFKNEPEKSFKVQQINKNKVPEKWLKKSQNPQKSLKNFSKSKKLTKKLL